MNLSVYAFVVDGPAEDNNGHTTLLLRDDPNEFGGNFLDMLTVQNDVNRTSRLRNTPQFSIMVIQTIIILKKY